MFDENEIPCKCRHISSSGKKAFDPFGVPACVVDDKGPCKAQMTKDTRRCQNGGPEHHCVEYLEEFNRRYPQEESSVRAGAADHHSGKHSL